MGWARDPGILRIPPITVEMAENTPWVWVKQYPILPEERDGLSPIIKQLLAEGILEPCMSPHNTPILGVKKADGTYRLVQDLREINKKPVPEHPVVSDPYTLLSKVPREHQWFTTIDLKDAFWACPLTEESRDCFAFEWEDPTTRRKEQLRWTCLPQGFMESPNLFGQLLEKLLEQFDSEKEIQILQSVDDLLVSGESQSQVRDISIPLLNFLGEQGLKVSQSKLQFVEQEVKFLGHLTERGCKKLSLERISGILSVKAANTKRDVRRLFGLVGYCRLWIEQYSGFIKFLYKKLVSPDPIHWTTEIEEQLQSLKTEMSTAPILSLPDLNKDFDLFIDTEGRMAYGVLTQE